LPFALPSPRRFVNKSIIQLHKHYFHHDCTIKTATTSEHKPRFTFQDHINVEH
jgi:hypothetical protein